MNSSGGSFGTNVNRSFGELGNVANATINTACVDSGSAPRNVTVPQAPWKAVGQGCSCAIATGCSPSLQAIALHSSDTPRGPAAIARTAFNLGGVLRLFNLTLPTPANNVVASCRSTNFAAPSV